MLLERDCLSMIQLDIDKDTWSVFNADLSFNQRWFGFGIGFITIVFYIISCIISYHYYPYIDRKQKLAKLESLNINPYSKKEIKPYLDKYTNNIQDINETIFECPIIIVWIWLSDGTVKPKEAEEGFGVLQYTMYMLEKIRLLYM